MSDVWNIVVTQLFIYRDVLYVFGVGVLLFLSYRFMKRAGYDERRSVRYDKRRIARQFVLLKAKLHNQADEDTLRRFGVPKWITSAGLNGVRIGALLILFLMVAIGYLVGQMMVSPPTILLGIVVAFSLKPKKPYPLFYIIQAYKGRHTQEISNEVYQFYNDIKAHFQTEGKGNNTYLMIKGMLPYYELIRPTLEKMLKYLENKNFEEAWDLFERELSTDDAKTLSIIMKEIESLDREQSLTLLDQKRQEFSNALYNRYGEYLKRRKTLIYSIVVVGIMSVFLNEITVFFMWYRDIMDSVNMMGN